ncbi:exported hypothetical protein [Paraburkholderia ribeironis]|uniref:Transmembrane protein n=1 Tax=Paraburkholderia ribeironis TaxID=1247936 RepID=A0A1N7RVS0_9BURK|nr:exported hypothetical protein [Paraburkholderia ribeironis]
MRVLRLVMVVIMMVLMVVLMVVITAAIGDHDATAQRAAERRCQDDEREDFFHDVAP